MRVLVACEFSGVVRDAFRARGHDAWSCDLLPAEDGSEFHAQDGALEKAVRALLTTSRMLRDGNAYVSRDELDSLQAALAAGRAEVGGE